MSKQCPHCKSRNPDEFAKCQWCGKGVDDPVEEPATEVIPIEKIDESPVSQWCGKSENDEVNNAKEEHAFCNEKKRNLFGLFIFGLRTALTGKLWAGVALWGAISIPPIVAITSFLFVKFLYPAFARLEAQGIGQEQIARPLENIYSVASGEISVDMCFVYFLIFCVISLISGLSVGIYGYAYEIVTKNTFKPIGTFWQYFLDYYLRITGLFFISIIAAVFIPMCLSPILGDNFIMSIFYTLWNIAISVFILYVPIVLISKKFGFVRTLFETADFIGNNFWKVIGLNLILGIFAFILHISYIFICLRYFLKENPGNLMLVMLGFVVVTIYQVFVTIFSGTGLYVTSLISDEETENS